MSNVGDEYFRLVDQRQTVPSNYVLNEERERKYNDLVKHLQMLEAEGKITDLSVDPTVFNYETHEISFTWLDHLDLGMVEIEQKTITEMNIDTLSIFIEPHNMKWNLFVDLYCEAN